MLSTLNGQGCRPAGFVGGMGGVVIQIDRHSEYPKKGGRRRSGRSCGVFWGF